MPKLTKINRGENQTFWYEAKINRINDKKSYAFLPIPYREAIKLKGKKLKITVEILED